MTRDVELTILGVVRDGGQALKDTLAQLDLLRSQVRRSSCVFATNDNSDDTMMSLENFAGLDSNTHILHLDGLAQSHLEKIDRIAVARNVVLAAMWDRCPSSYTLILDLDGPNTRLPIKRLLSAMKHGEGAAWDALFANSVPAYYDLLALRHPQWCPNDVWIEVRRRRLALLHLFPKQWPVEQLIHRRQYAIPKTEPLIAVHSAFGGLGLYRTNALHGAWYTAYDRSGALICEHVLLHRLMIAKGKRLFIDPAMLNIAPSEHLGTSSGSPYPGFTSA